MHFDDPRDALFSYALQSHNIDGAQVLLNASMPAADCIKKTQQNFILQSFDVPVCAQTGAKPVLDIEDAACVFVRGTRQRDETLGLIAQACDMAQPNATIFVLQANALGAEGLGKTLRKTLTQSPVNTSKFHGRILQFTADQLPAEIRADWLKSCAPMRMKPSPYMGQAGLFSHLKVDAGTQMLLDSLPDDLHGVAGDFGCGPGLLSLGLLAFEAITQVHAIDSDWRAVELCKTNVAGDARLIPHWADARQKIDNLPALDVCVVNPPFHAASGEDKDLGQKIVTQAYAAVKKGGQLFLVANRQLPYEDLLPNCTRIAEDGVYKILQVVKN